MELLANWLERRDADTFPFSAVLDEYRFVGKHFVPESLLETLASIRDEFEAVEGSCTAKQDLQSFLDTALDKHDGRYDYPTYLALNVLALPTIEDDTVAQAEHKYDRLFVQLIADLVRFELDAAHAQTQLMPQMRPDLPTSIKRCKLGLMAARAAAARLGVMPEPTGDPLAEAHDFCVNVTKGVAPAERQKVRLSMLPVYVIHDEHMFIRVLQSFEATFAVLTVQLQDAVVALVDGQPDRALECIAAAQTVFRDAAPLFSLLGTMQVEAFRIFRTYTEGASAIQSRNYKLVESICRQPDAERVESTAYGSVPEIRARVLSQPATLNDVFATARNTGQLTRSQQNALEHALQQLAATLLQWRRTHYRLALRMLGERSGTGYTQGTPYLRSVQDIPVFPSIATAYENEIAVA